MNAIQKKKTHHELHTPSWPDFIFFGGTLHEK